MGQRNGQSFREYIYSFHSNSSISFQVTEMTFDYTECETVSPSTSLSQLNFVNIPHYSYRLSSADSKSTPSAPQYAFFSDASNPDVSKQQQCIIEFDVVGDLKPSLFLYYKLTNFYQNHRRYVKSLDTKQLKGKPVSVNQLEKGDCKPLASINNKAIYPCGLIANSQFNGMSDSFSSVLHCSMPGWQQILLQT
jgi:hypothetical protein